MQRDERPAKADGKRPNLPGLLGAMKRRHQGERSALRARQRLEQLLVQGFRAWF